MTEVRETREGKGTMEVREAREGEGMMEVREASGKQIR
jgi:hypothetical protein